MLILSCFTTTKNVSPFPFLQSIGIYSGKFSSSQKWLTKRGDMPNAARVVAIPAVAAPVITIVWAIRTAWPVAAAPAPAQVSPITTAAKVAPFRVSPAGAVAVTVAVVVYNAAELRLAVPQNPRASSARSESISTNPSSCFELVWFGYGNSTCFLVTLTFRLKPCWCFGNPFLQTTSVVLFIVPFITTLVRPCRSFALYTGSYRQSSSSQNKLLIIRKNS